MFSRRVSIVIPSFNEEDLVVRLLEKVVALRLPEGLEKEIVIVDDGSRDATAERIGVFVNSHPESGILFLRHSVNRGKGAALRTGFGAATGEVLIVQDADLEYDPEDIPRVIDPVLKGRADVVYGSRILYDKEMGHPGVLGWLTGKHPDSDFMAYLGGVIITQFANLLTGAKLTDEPTGYKCFRRSILQGLVIECDDFSWEPEVTIKLMRRGFEIAEVPISYRPRTKREGKKINWRHGFKALATLLRYRFRNSEVIDPADRGVEDLPREITDRHEA